jgi:hypothetical protein
MIPSKIKFPICGCELDTDSENTAFGIRQESMRIGKSAFLEKTEQCEEWWSKRKAGEAATKPENPSLLSMAMAFFGRGAK